MADTFLTLRVGEIRPVYGSATVESGTLTISGTATYALYDSTGTSLESGNVDGQTAGAAATVQAWKRLDFGSRAAGVYTALVTIVATGSDSISRTFKTVAVITLEAIPEGTVRDDMQNLVRRCRTLVGDNPTDAACRAFEDWEIQEALDVYRCEVRYLPLEYLSLPTYASGGAVSYLTYQAPYPDWEEDAALVSATYASLTPTTSNYQVGRWTFTTEPTYPVYLTGQHYDLYGAAADLLERYAASQKAQFTFSPGSGNYTRSQKFSQPLALAAEYRARQQARSVPMNRGDLQGYPTWDTRALRR